MDDIPRPGDAGWALVPPPPDLANRILQAAAKDQAAPPLDQAAGLVFGLTAVGWAVMLATGAWAPVLATAQQISGWLAAASALTTTVALWPVVGAGVALVACEVVLLAR